MNKAILFLAAATLSSCANIHKKYVDCIEGNPTACYSLERKCAGGNQKACEKRDELPLANKRSIWWEFKKRDMIPPQWTAELPPISDEERKDEELALQKQSVEEQRRANRINAFQAIQAAQPQRVDVHVKQAPQYPTMGGGKAISCTQTRIGNTVQTNCR